MKKLIAACLLFGLWVPAGAAAEPSASERPGYVVAGDGVHAVSASDWALVHQQPCKPAKWSSWHRPPAGLLEHCQTGLLANGGVMHGQAPGETAKSAFGGAGLLLWGYAPFFRGTIAFDVALDRDWSAGFELKLLGGGAFSVPGVALRGGLVLAGSNALQMGHARAEFPAVELGLVPIAGRVVLEVGIHAAPAVVKSSFTPDDSEQGGALWGPLAVLGYRGDAWRALAMAEVVRLERETPFHEADVRACGGTATVLVCLRGQSHWVSRAEAPAKTFNAFGAISTFTVSIGWAL